MATNDPRQSDRDCGQDISELLRQVFCLEPPREEFVASLQDVLRAELGSASQRQGGETGRRDDAVRKGDALAEQAQREHGSPRPGASAVRRLEESKDSAAVAASPPKRRKRRSLVAAVTAATIVISVAVWSSRPSYSWTSMMRALESEPWVESIAEGRSGETVRNWFSQDRRVMIRRSDENLVWDDLAAGVRSRYRFGSDVLVQSRLVGGRSRTVEQSLLSLLADEAVRLPEDDDEQLPGRIEVAEQSWRDVLDGGERWVELEVVLSRVGTPEERIRLVFRLDPESHLPQSCRVLDTAGRGESVVKLVYPGDGPREVYELGVPRTVVVRDANELPDSARIAEVPAATPTGTPDASVAANSLSDELARPGVHTAGIASREPLLRKPVEHDGERDAEQHANPQSVPPPPVIPVAVSSAEMTQRVDELMAELWEHDGISPVEGCGDFEFLRRVYLDLTGRVPRVSEVRAFIEEVPAGRRERLVEQLLARRDHATHLAAVWRRFLLPEGVDLAQYGGTASFEQWLTDHFRTNTPYDEVVRELLLAEGRVSESGPILFYTALKLAPEALAAQTSRAFLGMRLECAQCHDHFFDNRWKQEDFWGYAAFFARISRPEGKMERVSPVLRVRDTNRGDVTLPDQDEIVRPRYPLGETLAEEPPTSSRRQELADWMTTADNPHFARAAVNRVWAHLFGRGIVEPVDDMRSDHPPVCPEVLDELAGYFVSTGFDLRDLFRVIVLSQTYQRSSGAWDGDPSRSLQFAQMNMKSLTAEQLYDSIAVATRLAAPVLEDGSLMRQTNVSRQAFIKQFQAPPGEVTDYQAGIPQALTLMNGGLIQGATGLQTSGILRSLEAPFFTDEQRIETLFLATLSRPPDDIEAQTMLEYVMSPDGEPEGDPAGDPEGGRGERLGDILWALLNSAEFTLNH